MPNAGQPVKVIQFESPADVAEDQPKSSGIDWVATSMAQNPGTVDASIDRNQIDIGPAEMLPSLAVATTESTVSLSWRAVPGSATYTIKRDDRNLGQTPSTSFQEGGLTSGATYTYRIIADISGQTAVVSDRTLKATTTGALKSERAPGSLLTQQAYQPYNNAVEYKTFIPNSRVGLNVFGAASCEVFGQDGWEFGGDNRGYRAPSASAPNGESQFRTFMWATVNWGNPDSQSLVLLKAVGPTTRYRYGSFVDTRTASSAGMQFTEAYRSGSYAQVRFKHDVGNPYCSIGSIQYNVMNRFYRSGLIEMVGWRFQAPAHEAYARFNPYGTEYWQPLIQRPNNSFDCLFGPRCPVDQINTAVSG
ncbi:hypothetical protein SPF06_04285 [Sinomonas sp. JGH33]|uniref:Fibronectin type-III domain-containing protein n=1 Tax=Sinomonas terricola TaxID=3110330 RepID=A0ABU5T2P9_9MICC|nr:hypothetical protein [Sinomonas sp. JGH33]MEA5453934.1 hypothetical protein [Sinomonas sp. JGH33]